jgi:acyl carrier protein
MNIEEEIRKILDLYYNYFKYEDFEEVDSLSKMDILTELEDEYEANIPLSVFDSNPDEETFINLVAESIRGQKNV